jgi:hypothetical protein
LAFNNGVVNAKGLLVHTRQSQPGVLQGLQTQRHTVVHTRSAGRLIAT